MDCNMPTSTLATCKRGARYLYLSGEGTSANPARTVAAYCAQHDRAGGRYAMLRPRPWEFDSKLDTVNHTIDPTRRVWEGDR